MRIISLDATPVEKYAYWNVAPSGQNGQGRQPTELVYLPILTGFIDELSKDVDALIVTSDLQGKVVDGENEYLLGEKLPSFLSLLIELEFPKLDKRKVGVLLCGDLYTTLQKRGGSGDVRNVWRTFNQEFKWVVGVAGNHDHFGSDSEFQIFKSEAGIHYLHKQIKQVDGLALGGISGIIGRTDKPNRVEEGDYLQSLKRLLLQQPDAVLLHQGPNYPAKAYMGEESIRKVIENSPSNLILCGHCHWEEPLLELSNGTQVLNVDSRTVILLHSQLL